MVGLFKLGKFPKTGLFKQTESYELPFLSIMKFSLENTNTANNEIFSGVLVLVEPPNTAAVPSQVPSGTTGARGFSQADGHEVLCWLD